MNNAYITTASGDVYEYEVPENIISIYNEMSAYVSAQYLTNMEFITAETADGKSVAVFCKHIVSTYAK